MTAARGDLTFGEMPFSGGSPITPTKDGENPFKDLEPEEILQKWPFRDHEELIPTSEVLKDLSTFPTGGNHREWIHYLASLPWIPRSRAYWSREVLARRILDLQIADLADISRQNLVIHEALFRYVATHFAKDDFSQNLVRRAYEDLRIELNHTRNTSEDHQTEELR